MLSEIVRAILEGTANIAESLPKTVVLIGEKPAGNWVDKNSVWISILATIVSAGSAAVTAWWAKKSASISRELYQIEKSRELKEDADLRLYQDPKERRQGYIGTVFNRGRSSTRIERSFVSRKPDGSDEIFQVESWPDSASGELKARPLHTILKSGDLLRLGMKDGNYHARYADGLSRINDALASKSTPNKEEIVQQITTDCPYDWAEDDTLFLVIHAIHSTEPLILPFKNLNYRIT